MSEIPNGIVPEQPVLPDENKTDEIGIVQNALNGLLDDSPEGLDNIATLMKHLDANGNRIIFVQSDPETGTVTEIKKG